MYNNIRQDIKKPKVFLLSKVQKQLIKLSMHQDDIKFTEI